MTGAPAGDVRNGAFCRVVAGTHAGKSGTVEDRKVSRTGAVGESSRMPDHESKPSAWPSSCSATPSKSTVPMSTPSVGSKSNSKFELKPTEGGVPSRSSSPVGSATAASRPMARRTATGE